MSYRKKEAMITTIRSTKELSFSKSNKSRIVMMATIISFPSLLIRPVYVASPLSSITLFRRLLINEKNKHIPKQKMMG